MKSTTRYSLIAFGFFVFIILAPLIVLYVSGTKFDLGSRDASVTGIFDAKTNPSNATLFIDEKEHSKTPAIARFLNQGEYVFTLKKDGYYDWSKRLPLEGGQVTYAQVGVSNIHLIKKTEPFIIEEADVSSFKLVNDNIWYTQGNDLVYAYINDPAKKNFIKNIATGPLTLTELRNKKHLLVNGAQESVLVNMSSLAVTTLPFKVEQTSELQMASDNTAIYISGGRFYSYSIPAQTSVVLRADIKAFTIIGNVAYFVKNNGEISSAIWNGATFIDEQVLIADVTLASDLVEIQITDRKELFLKNGGSGLYRVGQTLELVAPQVEVMELDLGTNELTFVSSGELWFYNFLANRAQLLTRTTSATNAFIIHSSIGYGFVAKSDGLEAIEIDTRDQQNRYQLLKDKPVWQIDMTNNQKTIVALQDGSLVMIEVRN